MVTFKLITAVFLCLTWLRSIDGCFSAAGGGAGYSGGGTGVYQPLTESTGRKRSAPNSQATYYCITTTIDYDQSLKSAMKQKAPSQLVQAKYDIMRSLKTYAEGAPISSAALCPSSIKTTRTTLTVPITVLTTATLATINERAAKARSIWLLGQYRILGKTWATLGQCYCG